MSLLLALPRKPHQEIPACWSKCRALEWRNCSQPVDFQYPSTFLQIYSTKFTIYRILGTLQPQSQLSLQCNEAKIVGPYSDEKKNHYHTTSPRAATLKFAYTATATASLQLPLRKKFCHSSTTCFSHRCKWYFLMHQAFLLYLAFLSSVVRFLMSNAAASCLVGPPLSSLLYPH